MSTTKSCPSAKRGYPLPYGVTVLSEGINFALFCRHGSQVTLVLDYVPPRRKRPIRVEIELHPEENRTGDIWHILLETTNCNLTYGYRIDGPNDPSGKGLVYQPDKILIDPYCHAFSARPWGNQARYGSTPCCKIINHSFDWQNDRPLKTPLAETIIYEMHVRGFTKGTGAELKHPGTYKGIIEKISYLKSLGVTAIELMPITEFDENDNVFKDPVSGKQLKNFWGYNPVSFFALKSGYAADPANHIDEFKAMVLALHQAGIEVILDMVYNHTGEGGYDGTTSSFRGIDNSIFYLLDPHDRHYLNFSGCGNTMNCNHPVVRSLIRDSLRYWVMEMHVDGFRFDLASILGRDKDGNVQANPPMIEIIAEDPVLRDTKMIAEAWDAAGLYQVGSFSTDVRWGEWNGPFRDDIRAFMAGHSDMITRLATRIAGSSDLYQVSRRSPLSSINFITSHDGFTLHDLVSYDQKHNYGNGENNRDGDNHNLSWNSGCEGRPCSPVIEQLRSRRMRSMIVILLLSQGVPMITAGDEFGRSQNGNNNAWCQDNSVGWLDWSLAQQNQDLLHFFRQCIHLRKQHPVFRREEFFKHVEATDKAEQYPEITWQYLIPEEQNWASDCHGLGVLLYGQRPDEPRDDDFFIMLNGSRDQTLHFTPPPVPANSESRRWHTIINAAATPPEDIRYEASPRPQATAPIPVPPLAVIVLQSLSRRYHTTFRKRNKE